MSNKATQFNSETGSEAGKKSKRGPSVVTALKRYLEKNPEKLNELAEKFFDFAVEGSFPHGKLITEYFDGKVPDILKGDIDVKNVKLSKKEYEKARSETLKDDDC